MLLIGELVVELGRELRIELSSIGLQPVLPILPLPIDSLLNSLILLSDLSGLLLCI